MGADTEVSRLHLVLLERDRRIVMLESIVARFRNVLVDIQAMSLHPANRSISRIVEQALAAYDEAVGSVLVLDAKEVLVSKPSKEDKEKKVCPVCEEFVNRHNPECPVLLREQLRKLSKGYDQKLAEAEDRILASLSRFSPGTQQVVSEVFQNVRSSGDPI